MPRKGETIDEYKDAGAFRDFIASKLETIKVDSGQWLTLFRDRITGEFWEMSFPHSEMHGGGPRLLTCLGSERPPTWGQKSGLGSN